MSSSDSDQYEDLPNLKNKKFQVESDEEDDFDDDDDNELDGQGAGDYDDNDLDDDEDGEKDGQKITAWGSQKKRFYQEGDEEASDDEAEEEEARLIEKLQNEKLDQSHFFDVFGDAAGEQQEQDLADEDKEEDITGDSLKARLRSLENLADSEKLAFLKKESPELLNIIKELKTSLKEVKQRFLPLVSYFKNRKGENREGQKYIELKFNLLMSYCMSLSFYILLNIQGKSVKDHPVIKKLISVRTMLGRLKPLDKKLQPEINQLLKDIQNNKTTEKAGPVVQKPVIVEKSIKPTKEKPNGKAKPNMFAEEPKVQAKPVAAKKVEKQAPKELLAKRSRDELIKSNKKKVEEDFDDEISDSGDENADLYGGFGEDDDKDEGGLDEEDEFYRKIKKVKQMKRDNISKEKQDKNAVKFEPNPSHFLEEDDVRGINRKIMKNKGLTRKRGKNHEKNSRVKFKNRFEKAQHKLKSQGKFVREKGDVYTGETRAIKSGMIRSTKIGRQ